MACQKNNPTNGTNCCKKNIPRMKSRSMCWTYQTNICENSSIEDIQTNHPVQDYWPKDL
jgi:hypothetical protein